MKPDNRGMDDTHSVTRVIAGLRTHDPAAAEQIWQRYFQRLLPLARAKLQGLPHAAVDEEDVLVSVFDRFFHAASADRFARLQDRNDLWQILMLLIERRIADEYRRSATHKRGGGLEHDSLGTAEIGPAGASVADSAPGPEFLVIFNDSLGRALRRLSDGTTREVALLRMEGYENLEIAERLKISLSSVERKLRVIRQVWTEEFAQD